MKIYRGYKTELRLNNKQRTLCLKSAGVARFAYNWGLRIKIDEYQAAGKSPGAFDLHRRLTALKKTEFPWMYEVSKCCPQEALRDLDRAFQHFFRRVRNGEKPGFPKFKSRKKKIGSFRLRGDVHVKADKIKLPRLGWLKLKQQEYLPADKKILSATVLDDGTVFENPKALLKLDDKLQRQHKIVSRRKKGSQNRKKAVRTLQQLYYRVACVRKHTIHNATTAITRRYGVIGIESLNVKQCPSLKQEPNTESLCPIWISFGDLDGTGLEPATFGVRTRCSPN